MTEVGWGWLFGSAIGATSVTGTHGKFLRQDTFGHLYEMDIVMDIRFAQSFDDVSYYARTAMPHILVHEVGHFIGLGHSDVSCSVMRPSGVGSATLCDVDVAGAVELYFYPEP